MFQASLKKINKQPRITPKKSPPIKTAFLFGKIATPDE